MIFRTSGGKKSNVILKLKIAHRKRVYPANIYLFKVNNRNTRKRCEICSKLTIKTPLVFLLLTYFTLFSTVSIIELEQVNVTWVRMQKKPH